MNENFKKRWRHYIEKVIKYSKIHCYLRCKLLLHVLVLTTRQYCHLSPVLWYLSSEIYVSFYRPFCSYLFYLWLSILVLLVYWFFLFLFYLCMYWFHSYYFSHYRVFNHVFSYYSLDYTRLFALLLIFYAITQYFHSNVSVGTKTDTYYSRNNLFILVECVIYWVTCFRWLPWFLPCCNLHCVDDEVFQVSSFDLSLRSLANTRFLCPIYVYISFLS